PVGAGAVAEVLRGEIVELVRFVEDGTVASGDHLAVFALSDSRIGAQQVMIDDDHIRGGGAAAHRRHEAVLVARTLGAEARICRRRYFVPERKVFGQSLDRKSVV